MKLFVDPQLCIGCGSCTIIANKVFALDEKSLKAKVIKQPKEKSEAITMAINSCPVGAIKIKD